MLGAAVNMDSARTMSAIEPTGFKQLEPGTVIAGAYRIVRPLAEGGMGVIYEVDQVATGARRALKVMHARFASDETLRARFVQEARLAASIPSDHVAQVLDSGQDEASGALYMVMELLEGETLSREVRRRGSFAWKDVLAIVEQVAHAIRAAHSLAIVHRDLKPANIFLARSRHATLPFTVKVLDFGIAKALVSGPEATVAVLGTPAWMAPEQAAVGAPIGPAADIWSLGLLTFWALTSKHYFPSANIKTSPTAAILREVVVDDLAPASDRAAQLGVADRLPPGFDAWFFRCVDRNPERRFSDARTAFDALARLPPPMPIDALSGFSHVARPSSPPPPRLELPPTSLESPRAARVPESAPPLQTTVNERRGRRPSIARVIARSLALGVGLVAIGAATATGLVHLRPPQTGSGAASAARSPEVFAGPAPIVRVHGSDTVDADLMPALAEAYLRRRTGVDHVVIRPAGPGEIFVEAREGQRVVESIEIESRRTATTLADLRADRCDMSAASRSLGEIESSSQSSPGDLRSTVTEQVIALSGIAVVVSPHNPIAALSKEQLTGIFSGDIRRWSDLGGADAPVVVLARDDGADAVDTFQRFVLGDRPLSPDARRYESSKTLSDTVASTPDGIGFVELPYVRGAKPVMVGDEHLALRLPSPMTVATEEYLLTQRLVLYVAANAPREATELVDFALSDEGQNVVTEAGFVDLRPRCDATASRCPKCVAEYRDLVRRACRVTIDFRFEHGDTQFDSRALRDLERLTRWFGQSQASTRRLVLLGFSDTQGRRGDNIIISQRRAEFVASQLRARGIPIAAVQGLGPDMLVADDSTEEGQARNRRVEVWVR
jgi:phosphate transport system substrate-binding protein